MKDLFLRCALIISVLVAITPCNRIHSCFSEPGWGDTRMVFFNPELGEDSTGLKPFFYSYYYLFPNDYDGYTSLGQDNTINDYRRNCREWQAYLGGKIYLEDIYKVIYGSSADSFATALKTQTLGDFLPGNTFLKALQKPANAAALKYLDFAKRFEFQQFESASDPWEEPRYYQNGFRQDSVMLDRLAQESVQELEKASDPFLRQRWAYQRINILYYKGGKGVPDSLSQTFAKYFDLKRDKTVLLPWALLKVAELNPNLEMANYQLALVFERCQSKRLRAIQLFASKSTEKTLPYARNGQEKATILTLRAIQNPGRGLSELKRISRLDPKSAYLPLLLTREINKVEDWLLTRKMTGQEAWHSFEPDYDWDENYDRKMDRWRRINVEKDRQYLHELRSVVAQMAAKQQRKPKLAPFLQLALAHLYYMEQRYPDAWRTLQAMRTGNNAHWQLQKNIQELLLLPQQADVRRPAVQVSLYKRLHYIRENALLLSEPARQLSRIYLALSHAFLAKKDIVTAGLFFGRASRHTATRVEEWWTSADAIGFYDNMASMKDLEALERLLQKKKKTPFEKWITEPYQKTELDGYYSEWSYYDTEADKPVPVVTADALHELMGTFAMRDGNLRRAATAFGKIDTAYWNRYYGVWSVDICGSTQFIAADSLPPLPDNNKYRIAKKMLDLQQEAIRNPAKRAENYYLLGNAWFHCSYWGCADGILTLHSSSSETDGPDPFRRGPTYLTSRPNLARYGHMYYRCTRAAAYFRKSLAARPNRELAARAFYMLAECDRRDRWMRIRRGQNTSQEEGGVTSPMFKTWAKRYGKTAAYAECLDACPDLKVYLGVK